MPHNRGAACPLPIFVAGIDFQNGRFGNQKPQGKLREGKLTPPKESVTKKNMSTALFQ